MNENSFSENILRVIGRSKLGRERMGDRVGIREERANERVGEREKERRIGKKREGGKK